jgi:hypothetical protein
MVLLCYGVGNKFLDFLTSILYVEYHVRGSAFVCIMSLCFRLITQSSNLGVFW